MNNTHTFDKAGYIALLQNLLDAGGIITPVKDHNAPGKKVLLRHDVDDNMAASIKMAELEHDLGIRSTYYILNTAPYWGSLQFIPYIDRLHALGHEIGWHNNAIAEHLTTGKPIAKCIEEPLRNLRHFAPVTGSASHGDRVCHQHKFLNYYIFEGSTFNASFPNYHMQIVKLADLGLEYEAYHIGNKFYLSDSGGKWQQDNDAIIKSFGALDGDIQVLIHPQWWTL